MLLIIYIIVYIYILHRHKHYFRKGLGTRLNKRQYGLLCTKFPETESSTSSYIYTIIIILYACMHRQSTSYDSMACRVSPNRWTSRQPDRGRKVLHISMCFKGLLGILVECWSIMGRA